MKSIEGEERTDITAEEKKYIPARRDLTGSWRYVVAIICVAAVAYHIYYPFARPFFALEHRVIHLLWVASLGFLIYPFRKGKVVKNRPGVSDIILWLSIAGILIWLFVFADDILRRAGTFLDSDVKISIVLIILVLELCRRTMGIAVPILVGVFLAYTLWLSVYMPGLLFRPPIGIERVATYLSLSTDGIFGIPLGVSANFIFLFILYGAILRKTGGGNFFTDIAFALTGRARGGPAKAAVVASGGMGMISGSSVANTTTTGAITIPLIKGAGFPAHFAGAVEASASTMGQFMPPVMGAAAFIMAEFLAVPYLTIVVAAAIPGVLAFFAVFMQVHFRAMSMDIKVRDEINVKIWETMKAGWHHLIAIAVLVGVLVAGYSPERAAISGILTQVAVCMLRHVIGGILRRHAIMSPRDTIRGMVDVCRESAIGAIEVAAVCAAVGLIIGPITLTGLGLNFSGIVAEIAHYMLIIGLPIAMISSLILGMGVPTTAKYIIVAALVAPALIRMGIPPIAAHLFIFYWAVMADITPPVALAAYAGAGIAKANPWKTGLTAFQLGLAGYIIPFIFVFNTGLLLRGSFLDIALITIVTVVAVIALAAAIQNWFLIRTRLFERLLLFAIPILCIPAIGMHTLIIPLLLGVVLASQWIRRRSLPLAHVDNP